MSSQRSIFGLSPPGLLKLQPLPWHMARRQSTGNNPLTLSSGYRADLDSTDPAWDVQSEGADRHMDIVFSYGKLREISPTLRSFQDRPNMRHGYKKFLDEDETRSGTSLCVRTSESRFAFVTIKKVRGEGSSAQIQLDVTVWDPQFNE